VYRIVLQCVAVSCSVLPCVAMWCSVLRCIAACCKGPQTTDVEQCVAVCCSALVCCVAVCWCVVLVCALVCCVAVRWCVVLVCVAVCCSVLQGTSDKGCTIHLHTTKRCNTLKHTHCNTLQHTTTHSNALQQLAHRIAVTRLRQKADTRRMHIEGKPDKFLKRQHSSQLT